MKYQFTRNRLNRRQAFLERFFQILPGFSSWTILLGLASLAFFKPLWAAIVVIVFDFYWLLRLFYITVFLIVAYIRLSIETSSNWESRILQLESEGEREKERLRVRNLPWWYWKNKISWWLFKRKLRLLTRHQTPMPLSKNIYHLVLVPVIREGLEILQPSVLSYLEGGFNPRQIVVVIALEERAPDSVKRDVEKLQAKFKDSFFDFLVVEHPQNLEGEESVKGANATYAAKQAKRFFEEKKIPVENIIISCFDADTVVSQHYFACLTYNFMVCPYRECASFQPIPVYHNNIWDVPGFARILEIGSSFFQLTEATHPEKLVTFSSHSMSFKALIEVDYWPIDMISDDSAIFWKAFIHFDGKYRVYPMYVTLSMDVAVGDSWWKTIKSVYRQKRRWAWGVENFPIVMRAFLRSNKISLYDKLRHGFKLFENHVAWATWPILLTVMGWLPVLFAGREFSNSVLYYNAPRITSIIFNLAALSLLITIVLSLCLLPKKKVKFSFFWRIWHALEWLAIPIVFIFFSALPALEAQTRLMFGRYMEFSVTEKKRKRKSLKRNR